MSLFFNPTPTSHNLPGATTELINQPNIIGSSVIIGEESDVMQIGGKKPKGKTMKKSIVKITKNPKAKTTKPKTVKTSKTKVKTVKKSKVKKTPKSKPVKKQIDLYKKYQLEKLAKKHKINLKKRDGTPKTKLQLFRSLKRKELL